jgi:hypothetical protein
MKKFMLLLLMPISISSGAQAAKFQSNIFFE